MAKAISDEELQLKKRARRRLVGAIALVLLVVVFLPMLLDSEPKPLNQDIAITIPPVPNPEAGSQPSASAAATASKVPQPTPVAAMPTAQREPPASEPKVEALRVEPTLEPKHEAKTTPAPLAKASGDVFVVQLGAFSNAANAKALQKKLQENKFKAYTETIKSAGGERTRVRAGPYASREAAEKVRDRMRAMKLTIGAAAVVRQGD